MQAKSALQVNQRKFRILRAIQNLFSQLQGNDFRATSTTEVTSSFGWGGNGQGGDEVREQHDVGELNNILIEALEKCFEGTEYDSVISQLFFGMQNSYVTCDQCGISRNQPERFLQLNLQVQGLPNVEAALEVLFAPEYMTGENKVTCDSEVCMGQKTDSRRGIEIAKLPPVLTFCLNRFELDYQTWERKKLNDWFEYPLELDMAKYLSQQLKE